MNEEAVTFGSAARMVGIATDPPELEGGEGLPAIIMLNSGSLQRVGPGRLHVKIARLLAQKGFVSFRFDFSGIGDSKFRGDNLPFEKSAVSETQDAMDFLTAAGIESLFQNQKRLETPHLNVRYEPTVESTFWRT